MIFLPSCQLDLPVAIKVSLHVNHVRVHFQDKYEPRNGNQSTKCQTILPNVRLLLAFSHVFSRGGWWRVAFLAFSFSGSQRSFADGSIIIYHSHLCKAASSDCTCECFHYYNWKLFVSAVSLPLYYLFYTEMLPLVIFPLPKSNENDC